MRDPLSIAAPIIDTSGLVAVQQKAEEVKLAKAEAERKRQELKYQKDMLQLSAESQETWRDYDNKLNEIVLRDVPYYASQAYDDNLREVNPEKRQDALVALGTMKNWLLIGKTLQEIADKDQEALAKDTKDQYDKEQSLKNIQERQSLTFKDLTPEEQAIAEASISPYIKKIASPERLEYLRNLAAKQVRWGGKSALVPKGEDLSYYETIKEIPFTPTTKTSVEKGGVTEGGVSLDMEKFKEAVVTWVNYDPKAIKLYKQMLRTNPDLTLEDFTNKVLQDRAAQFQAEYTRKEDEESGGLTIKFGSGGAENSKYTFVPQTQTTQIVVGRKKTKEGETPIYGSSDIWGVRIVPKKAAEVPEIQLGSGANLYNPRTGNWENISATAGAKILMKPSTIEYRTIYDRNGNKRTEYYVVGVVKVGSAQTTYALPLSEVERDVRAMFGITSSDLEVLRTGKKPNAY